MNFSLLPFDVIPGSVYPQHYDEQLKRKISYYSQLLFDNISIEPEIFPSEPENYRMRAEFRIWHEDQHSFYCMHKTIPPHERFFVEDFPIATMPINQMMPKLLEALCAQDILRKKLFGVDFLANQQGELLISLLYHKPLCEAWQAAANRVTQTLNCQIIGRSRKQKIVLQQDYLYENFSVNGKIYRYQQHENSFTQPNAGINQRMLNWVNTNSQNLKQDALELFCGNGNFTLALSQNFNRVLATELSKTSIRAAQHNLRINGINNVDVVRLSCEETCDALAGKRPFRRLQHIDINSFQFSTVLVDPPRAGLDLDSLNFIQQFQNIIYISCNPNTLKHNLDFLTENYQIKKAAFFDQFPYTHHIESAVILARR